MTGASMLLGTAAYMSPEQAKGRPADKRSDIWAFGCVLFEMLTGKRPFDGEDVADTLAAVLRGQPDWRALPADIPSSLRGLVERCLQKDRGQRVGDIAVALFVLRESPQLLAPATLTERRHLACGIGGGGTPEELAAVQAGELVRAPQLLPDGDSLLFTIAAANQSPTDEARIVVQSLKSGQRKTLVENGTDGRYLTSGHLAYALGGVLFARPFSLRGLQVTGGPVPVIDGDGVPPGRSLTLRCRPFSSVCRETGSLVYVPGPSSPSATRIQLVLDDGKGNVTPLKTPPRPYQYPRASPDGRYVAFATDDGKDESISIYELAGTSSPRRITFTGRSRYPVWSGDGRWIAFQSDLGGIQRSSGCSPMAHLAGQNH